MTATSNRGNRGPAAAAGNRRAILDAARALFAERGYRVPLQAIAKAAGVGQGVLYRHFPNRLALAYAAFEDNFVDLRDAVGEADGEAFGRLWDTLVDQTVRVSAFVEMMLDARLSDDDYDGHARLVELIESTLPAAKRAGQVRADLDVDDVLLAWRMMFGVVITAPTGEQATDEVRRLPRPGAAGVVRLAPRT